IRDWSVTGVQTCALPILMVDVAAAGPGRRRERDAEAGAQVGGVGDPALGQLIEAVELSQPDRGLQVGQAVVVAEHLVPVALALADRESVGEGKGGGWGGG